MKTFDDLKSQWQEQALPETPKDGSKLVLKKIDFLQSKHRITNRVLLTTVLVLIGFFFYINAYKYMVVTVGLLLMIGTLLIRVSIEYFSIRNLKKLNVTKDAIAFKADMIAYYKARLKTHYIATPIIIFFYAVGFYLLLPSFKQSLSKGFYTYVWVSAIVLLFIIGFFIGREIKKELGILKKIT
ncbi:MAG: hypothetical protein ACOH2D_04545 [Gelidibacter sp.]|uniref:hypothetical protein n=1 Tax=Gelidibacter sp. TaxID=2018083 RepID=UPI003267E4D9